MGFRFDEDFLEVPNNRASPNPTSCPDHDAKVLAISRFGDDEFYTFSCGHMGFSDSNGNRVGKGETTTCWSCVDLCLNEEEHS